MRGWTHKSYMMGYIYCGKRCQTPKPLSSLFFVAVGNDYSPSRSRSNLIHEARRAEASEYIGVGRVRTSGRRRIDHENHGA